MLPITTVEYGLPYYADANSRAHLYCDLSIKQRKRKLVLYQLGGGWAPGTGQVYPVDWTPPTGTLLRYLFDDGHVIAHCGYSVLNPSAPTVSRGVFRDDAWFWPSFWPGPAHPLIDPMALRLRHAELDTARAVQRIMVEAPAAIPELDTRQGSWIGVGRSAGAHNLMWAGNRNLATPIQYPAPADLRFSTKALALVLYQYVGSGQALKPHLLQNHLYDFNTNAPSKVGDVPHEIHGRCWSLRWHHVGALSIPLFVSGDGVTVNPGPWTWESIEHTLDLTQVHADDQVRALEATGTYTSNSVFKVGPATGAEEDERYQWIKDIIDRFDK